MATILLVEDNDFIREAIVGYLKLDEHNIIEFSGVSNVLDTIKRDIFDLIILDVMLPDGDGFTLAKQIKKIIDVPIIFLTAKDSESDRITGFELGADDYIVKPFSTKELSLRVQALLKRVGSSKTPPEKNTKWTLNKHTLEIDQTKHRVLIDNKEIYTTSAEWKILEYISTNENIVVSRERILSECLNYFFEGSERTIDVHIANLRSKLGKEKWICTVRGYGYRFTGKGVEN